MSTRNHPIKPAIYLDRDGVIIHNRTEYVRSWAQVKIFPQALHALALLSQLPYHIVLVTNQSAVGRGLLPQIQAEEINQRLVEVIGTRSGRIDRVFMCPHAPNEACSCRKPAPGMLLEAASDLNIDLPGSIMVGDALTDLQAGQAAGVGQVVLLLTGRGAEQRRILPTQLSRITAIYPDLLAFAQAMLIKEP